MSIKSFAQAASIYRDSPNMLGGEETAADRVKLKRIIGLVASQAQLQASIVDARNQGYFDNSKGMAHLWERLQDIEDELRDLNKVFGNQVDVLPYRTPVKE